MLCLAIVVVGVTTVVRMPVDLFPADPDSGGGGGYVLQRHAAATNRGRHHRHLRALLHSGQQHRPHRVAIANRRQPDQGLLPAGNRSRMQRSAKSPIWPWPTCEDCRKGTLPPVVLKFDASSLPVCLVTLKGQGLNETQLHDEGQFNVRNQIANVPGASVPQPFGGKYRQIQFYIDPVKLEAAQMSPMDVVQIVNDANKILPAGDVRIGPRDYNIYSNSQLPNVAEMNDVPLEGDRQQRAALCRCRSRGRLLCHPVQHRARGWTEVGVPAHPEAGRQQQHHSDRQRRARSHQKPARRTQARWSPRLSSTNRSM